MKTIKITLALFLCSFVINAQETYKHSLSGIKRIKIFTNTGVELKIGTSNQLVIDMNSLDSHSHSHPHESTSVPSPPSPSLHKNINIIHGKKHRKDKAKGLKPLYSNGNDNTGYGLEITKDGNTLIIRDLKSFTERDDFVIQIPKGIDISLDCGNLGDAKVTGITSDIEVKTNIGNIDLIDITGPVTASTRTGDITVTFTTVNQSNPISLRTATGDVDVSLHSNTKANLELKTTMGTVYTNFDFKAQINKSSNPVRFGGSQQKINRTLNKGGVKISLKSSTGNIYLRKK